jgi:hypothetical protein
MSLSLMFRSGFEYLTAMWALIKSKVLFALLPIAIFVEVAPGGEELTMGMLIFCYVADSILGLLVAIQTKTFDWKKLPRLAYKLVVFYVTLKISQQTGDILKFYDYAIIGGYVFPLVLLIITTIEAGSAIANADKLYPNKATAVVLSLLNRISENAIQKIKDSVPDRSPEQGQV